MKLIFLDDMETRHAMMDYKNEGRYEIIHVRTVQEVVEAVLKNPMASLLFLDHDLGGQTLDEVYERKPGTKGSGSEAADIIAGLPKNILPKKIVLHTHNNVGAQYMYHALRDTGVPIEWRPFGNDIEDILSGTNITSISGGN